MLFTVVLYVIAAALLGLSFLSDRAKTTQALRKAWKSFIGILPDFAAVLALIGLLLTFLPPSLIARLLGRGSGIWGMLLGSAVGSITLIPGFIAFPLAATLLRSGAGVPQVVVFLSTLMMVGIVTLPMEIKYLGRREALWRNSLAYAFAFVAAWIVGVMVR